MAARANVQRLVVTHQGPNLARPGSMEKAVAEIAAIFKGELIFKGRPNTQIFKTRSYAADSPELAGRDLRGAGYEELNRSSGLSIRRVV